MPITTIEPRRLYRQVADQLRSLIDSGEFAVGERLPPERELAARLGISRPTVREALIALEVDGRVRIRVGSGIYVLAPGGAREPEPTQPVAGPFEILEARALLESVVAAEAARVATPADVRRLDHVLSGMRRARHPGPDSIAYDRAFHAAVAEILANATVTKIVGDLFDQRISPYFSRLATYFESAASWQAAFHEHTAIRDAIADGNGEAAAEAMRRHLQLSKARFSKTFGDGDAAPHEDRPRKGAAAQEAAPAGGTVTSRLKTMRRKQS